MEHGVSNSLWKIFLELLVFVAEPLRWSHPSDLTRSVWDTQSVAVSRGESGSLVAKLVLVAQHPLEKKATFFSSLSLNSGKGADQIVPFPAIVFFFLNTCQTSGMGWWSLEPLFCLQQNW